jgi:DNA-binding transcriptional LysR family regulator
LNIKHLEHLIALSQTGSFSRAAEQAFVTQSALSRSIQNLESELGGLLVDRIGKRNELTPLGREIADRASRLVQQAQELQRSARLFSSGETGSIRVGLGSGPGAVLMTPLLREMADHHPGVPASIARGSTELMLGQLRARQLDALVVDARRVIPAPDLRIEPLGELRAAFIASARHPLARRRSIAFEALLDYPIASTPLSDEVARLLVDQYGPGADPRQMTTLSCDDIGSLIDTVQATQAIFLGIAAAASEGIARRKLVELRITPAIRVSARFAYVTLGGRTEAPAMKFFRRFVAERLRE